MKHFTTLSKRMVLILLCLFVLMLCLWTYLTIQTIQSTLFQQKVSDLDQLIASSADYLKLYTDGINNSLLNLSSTIEVLNNPDLLPSVITSFQKEHSTKVYNVLYLASSTVYSNEMYLYEVVQPKIYDAFLQKAFASTYEGIQWSEPYISPLSLQTTIALFKPIPGAEKRIILVELNLQDLTRSLSKQIDDASWAIITQQGNIVYQSTPVTYQVDQPHVFGQDAERLLATQMPSGSLCMVNGEPYIFCYHKKALANWDIAAFMPSKTFEATIRPFVYQVLILGILVLAVMEVVTQFIGHSFSKPLINLSKKLQNASDLNDIDLTTECNRGNDEIGILARSLQELQQKIKSLDKKQKELMEQRRQLEIRMLQAQIHPHFLGNTLSCIASLAKEHKSDEVSSSLQALIHLLRFSITDTNSLVPLGDELACTESYLKLRQMRAPDLFTYEIFVPASHASHLVPKLILQPIVENSIVHGFQSKHKEGSIVIISYEKDGHLLLNLQDNGTGMDPQRLAAVRSGTFSSPSRKEGIGLNNVFNRLTLNDPNSKGGTITSTQDEGTTVTLDLGLAPHPI